MALYTCVMRSRVAEEIARSDRERVANMTPAQRIELALRLSDEGLASFMASQNVDRATALARIAATRRAGRPRSVSSERR